MTNQAQELKNDNIQVTVSKEPGCRMKLTVEVSPGATQAAHKKALKNINKEVSIPGFRKGKAPEAMIEQKFDKYIHQEWRDVVIQTAFKEAIDLVNVYPYSENSVNPPRFESLGKNSGATIYFEYECAPEVPTIDAKSLQIKEVTPKEVTQKDVDDALENLRFYHASWEDVTDRPVEEGDYVDLDIDTVDTPSVEICRNQRFHVQEGKMGEWMKKLLIGLHPGQTAEGVSQKEPHHHEHADGEECDGCHTDFTPTRCRIALNAIKKPVLPAVDDALAQKMGTPTAETLLERIRENLSQRAEQEAKMQMTVQIEKEILEKWPFDLPQSLLARERKGRLQNRLEQMRANNISRDTINEQMNAITAQINAETDQSFRLYFLLRKIAQENNIDVSMEEIIQETMRKMIHQQAGFGGDDSSLNPKDMQDMIRSQLLNSKTLTYLVDNATKIV